MKVCNHPTPASPLGVRPSAATGPPAALESVYHQGYEEAKLAGATPREEATQFVRRRRHLVLGRKLELSKGWRATDAERFEATYIEWSEMANAAVADLAKVGVNTVKFNVFSEELLAWCLLHNKPNNAASRAEFVAEQLRAGTGHPGNENRDA